MSRENEIKTAERMVTGFMSHRPALVASELCSTPHLDEDALSAFVESRLTESEAGRMVSHLVQCESCRKASAELLVLAEAFSSDEPNLVASRTPVHEPGGLRRFLEDLVSRIVGSDEQAVLAYHSADDEKKRKEEKIQEKEPSPREEESNGKL